MKLSDLKQRLADDRAERGRQAAAARAAHLGEVAAFVAGNAHVPLAPGVTEQERVATRSRWLDGYLEATVTTCDVCGADLLVSASPIVNVVECPGCGFHEVADPEAMWALRHG